MAEITIALDAPALAALLKAENRITNLTPALKSIGEYQIANVDENFRTESGVNGSWAPLSARYAARKAQRPRTIQKTLQKDGLLRTSIHYQVAGNQVKIGSDKLYAAAQELGFPPRNLPARSFLQPTAQQEQQFADILLEHLRAID